MQSPHPLYQFAYCPVCGSKNFVGINEKAKHCNTCRFTYYFNPSAAVACFVRNPEGELLFVRRANEPAKGTLDLSGGFIDMYETAEEAVRREIKEETNLDVSTMRYLFSIPNIYPYSGFKVQTVDLFFECQVTGFDPAKAEDDAAEIVILTPGKINPADFGLQSIRKGVRQYSAISSSKF
ncbi:MAG: NUDIX domain-containing protein [Tannerella sp.]|jgi:ADP-ribose pyrophosphatase YjhB (NUDIX family)|nr:NUDIX domain-containing protein [Tannerella sp.]